MTKEIIPKKIILNLNPDGSYRDGVLQYQLRIDGATDAKLPTIGLPSVAAEAADVIEAAMNKVRITEGING